MLEPYDNAVKVVWDILEFIEPLFKLLPKEIVSELKNGKRVEYHGYRLWLGKARHGFIFGVSYKEHKQIKGNIYSRHIYDTDIFELKQYFNGDNHLKDVSSIADKGDYLITTLARMGLNPKRLTSAASIYQECVLDKLPIPTIWNMPEESYPMMEMCANYIREWHGDFQSGNWEKENLYKYDLTSAYPSALAMLPNLKYAKYSPLETLKEEPYWGIMRGKLKIKTIVSPVVDEQGKNKVGEFDDEIITTDDWRCLKQWNLGEFKPVSGWYIILSKDYKIFDYIMRRLFDYRGGNPTRDLLAKAMSVSVWGKFLEMHDEDYGDYFNGIYACMVTSKVRAKVCEFIYEHDLKDSVVEVTVDGLRCKTSIPIARQRKFGEWRIVDDRKND